MPDIQINLLAVIIVVVANFIVGYVWYTPLFGRAWGKEMGIDPEEKTPSGELARGMIFMVIGNFLLAYVLAHNLAAWDPETWGLAPPQMSLVSIAGQAAFFTWLGFFLPVDLGRVAWERKSWKLFGIDTSYHFFTLLVASLILTYM